MSDYNLIQIKRGLEANRLAYTPLSGEFLFTTDNKQVFIGDGTTAGGINLLSSITTYLGTVATYNVGTTSGTIPVIGANGKLDASLIPSLAITDVFFAASTTEMTALSAAQTGDICIRTDESATYILSGTNPAVAADWTRLLTPTDTVLSVNGKTGVVVLNKDDIGLGNVENKSVAEILTNANLVGAATTETAGLTDNSTRIANTAWVRAFGDGRWMTIGCNIDAGVF
jgi:hypothetical protein